MRDAYVHFRAESSKDLAFSRAGEWMLDNFYIVEQTIHQIEEDLPERYYDQLPKLDKTALKGFPRIFGLAWEWVACSQSQLELTQTAVFVQEYQQVTPLTIGELWALPIMLRIGVLERLTVAVAAITGIAEPESLNVLPSLPAPPALTNESIVANCFLSLRLLSTTDWKDFFEQTSRVDQILRTDPAEIYAGMDFDTRNCYRSVIEELALHSNQSEETVAQVAIEFCRNPQDTSQFRKTHVGYYLVDEGRSALEKRLNYQTGWSARLRRWLLARPTATYLGSIGLITMLMVFGLLAYTQLAGGSAAQLILVGVLGLGSGAGDGHHPDALGGYPYHNATRLATHGFFGRHSSWLSYDGRRTDSVGKYQRTRIFTARAGNLLPVQSRSAAQLCAADRLHRRASAKHAAGCETAFSGNNWR